MGKTSRRKTASLQRETEQLRKQSAMLPFLLIFGGAWLVFGLAALGTGYVRQDPSVYPAGGAIVLLGAIMVVRAILLRRRVLAKLAERKGSA